jgi:rRNA-processing protein FCF1
MLAEDRAPYSFMVVTSDQRLGERARHLGAGVMSVAAFRRRMSDG